MLVSVIHQHESPTGIHFPPSSWIPIPSPSPPHPSGLSQSTGLNSICHTKRFPLAVYFTYGSAYVSMLFCQLVPPSPSPAVSTSLFSMSVFPLLFCKQVHHSIFLDSMFLFSHWVKSDSLWHHGPQHVQASLSLTISWRLSKFMSIASVIPSSRFILWCPLLLLPSIFPSIRDFSNEPSVRIRWPKY